MKYLFIAVILIFIFSCGSPLRTKPNGDEYALTVLMSCSSLYEFEQDCNIWRGASRTISVDGFEINIGATKDGKVILVMDANWISNSLSDFNMMENPNHTAASHNSFMVVKNVLESKEIKITKVIPLVQGDDVDGYILELDKDGFTILKTFTTE